MIQVLGNRCSIPQSYEVETSAKMADMVHGPHVGFGVGPSEICV
jgi:hypothetical protein